MAIRCNDGSVHWGVPAIGGAGVARMERSLWSAMRVPQLQYFCLTYGITVSNHPGAPRAPPNPWRGNSTTGIGTLLDIIGNKKM